MSARVLVVDDVEINVKLLEAKLASEYFDVITAANGIAALRLAAVERPDVILLDVMMPQMDGFDVCRRLKADPATADIPVVMVTALSDVADRLRGLEAGADDFLTKPVNDIALFARVRSLVRLKRMMDEWRLREAVRDRIANLPGEAAATQQAVDGARILVVEENRLSAMRIAETLHPIAEELVTIGTCAEALARIDPKMELAIVSMGSADGDPLRLVSQIRANEATRQLPVLLIGEEGELPRLAKGLDIGANDYIIRPLDRNELTARVRTQIRRKRLQDRLRQNFEKSISLALTDGLTGLYNRRYAAAHLEGQMLRAGAGGKPPSVLLFDIDRFKAINDGYGHAAGDEVLCEIAKRTLRDVRSFDLVARYGGEEFLVVMPETDLAVALAVAERLRQSIGDTPIAVSGVARELAVTVSIGVAAAFEGGDHPTALLKRADDALYAAKRGGRDRVVAWPPDDAPVAPAQLKVALL
jgi:two-component system cell cycle response regulator